MSKKFYIPNRNNSVIARRDVLLRKSYAMIEDVKSLDFDGLIADLWLSLEPDDPENQESEDPEKIKAIQAKIDAIESLKPLIKVMLEQGVCYGRDPSNGSAVLINGRSGRWNMLTNQWSGDLLKLDINFPLIGSMAVEVKISEFK